MRGEGHTHTQRSKKWQDWTAKSWAFLLSQFFSGVLNFFSFAGFSGTGRVKHFKLPKTGGYQRLVVLHQAQETSDVAACNLRKSIGSRKGGGAGAGAALASLPAHAPLQRQPIVSLLP